MCPECVARRKLLREALIQKRIKESMEHAAKGAAEMVGVKRKTGTAEASKPRSRPRRAKPKDSGAAG